MFDMTVASAHLVSLTQHFFYLRPFRTAFYDD